MNVRRWVLGASTGAVSVALLLAGGWMHRKQRKPSAPFAVPAFEKSIFERDTPPTLAEFLSSAECPPYLKTDLAKFHQALLWAREAGLKQGLVLDLESEPSAGSDDQAKRLPAEVRKALANPYAIWGHDPETDRWEALIAFKGPEPETHTLCWLKDAFRNPRLEVSHVTSIGDSKALSPIWQHRRTADTLADFGCHPIADGTWGDSTTEQVLTVHPTQGLCEEIVGIEGEDAFTSQLRLITRKQWAQAKVLFMDTDQVIFQIKKRVCSASRSDWDQWKNPERPELEGQDGE